MSIREACRPAVIAPLRGLSTNAQPDRKDARWLGGYLTSSALMLGATEMLTLSVLTGNLRAATIVRPRARAVAGMSARPWPGSTRREASGTGSRSGPRRRTGHPDDAHRARQGWRATPGGDAPRQMHRVALAAVQRSAGL